MAMLIRESIKQYHYIFIELSDPRTISWPFLSSPMSVVALLSSYVYFVKHLGPRLMKHREPFKLDRIIQVYNVIQVAMALYLVERASSLGWASWSEQPYRWFCEPIDFSDNPRAIATAKCTYLYFLIKVLDLMDTVFFVLRKNNRQITFLHVYHHAGMVVGVWGGTKYLPGGHGTFLGYINSVVHAVMYSYYLLTSIRPDYKKNIWWKKYITQMQMLQFLAVSLHSIPLLILNDCPYPYWFAFVLVPQNMFMFILFYDFYRKAYGSKKMAAVKPNDEEKKMT